MEIQQIIKNDGRKYIFEKEYPNFYLYSDIKTGHKRCFTKFEIDFINKYGALTPTSYTGKYIKKQ